MRRRKNRVKKLVVSFDYVTGVRVISEKRFEGGRKPKEVQLTRLEELDQNEKKVIKMIGD